MTFKQTGLWVTLFSSLSLIGCGGSSSSSDVDSEAEPKDVSISIPFEAKSGNLDVSCDTTLTNLGTSDTQGNVKYFAYYIHDVQLKDANGDVIETTLEDNDFQDAENGVVFLQYQDKDTQCAGTDQTTNKSVQLTISDADIDQVASIGFKVGVPFEINHTDPTNEKAIYGSGDYKWGWQMGRKVMRLDVAPVGGVTDSEGAPASGSTWNFHLGSTACSADDQGNVESCANPNRPEIVLTDFTASSDLSTKSIVLDYQTLVAGVTFNQDFGGKVGCMSFKETLNNDPECIEMMKTLGFSYTQATGAATQDQTQTLFTVQ